MQCQGGFLLKLSGQAKWSVPRSGCGGKIYILGKKGFAWLAVTVIQFLAEKLQGTMFQHEKGGL
jgi:hypothetical protein